MNINNLGLLNKVGNYINYADRASNEYAISSYLLKHINTINAITVNDIVDDAFVSHSGVRRFCVELGYNNFSDLKKSLDNVIFPSNIHLRNFEPIENYRLNLSSQINQCLKEIDDTLNNRCIKAICQLIHDYEEVYIVGANNTAANLLKFQQEMFYANKIIHLLHSNFEDTKNKFYSAKNCLIIIISVSGIFAQSVESIIKNRDENHRLLITANQKKIFKTYYEKIIYISPTSISDDNLGVYGKYGITYVLDLISEEYIHQYRLLK